MLVNLRKAKDTSGIVMVVVFIIIMVMTIVSATIFSQSMSQSKTARAQVDEIVAEQLAKGVFWNSYKPDGVFSTSFSPTTLNNRVYTVTISNPGSNVFLNVSY